MYMYMETSGGTAGDSVDLVSPPILIDSLLSTVELGYHYFMHGATMNQLKVLVDTNGVENLLATYVGQQQLNQTDPWNFDSRFLNGYNGKSVQIIFRGFNSSGFTADIAVDDISIDPVLPIDAGVTDILSPSGALCPGVITPIVEVRNFGSTQLDSVVVYWDVNGVLDSVTYIGTVAPGARFPVTLGNVNIVSGQIYNVNFFTGDINGQPDQFPGNDALVLNGLRTGLSGTVTVDASQPASGTNFQTFASLAATLNNYGMCGNATVNVANGTYNESFYLDNVPGLDASNTLTIDGGDSSLTILTHNASVDAATITLDGSDYVTIQNMTVQMTAPTSNGASILLVGETNNNTIQNCVVRYNTNSTFFSSAAIAASGTNNSATTNYTQSASFNTIANNRIIGGNHGIRLNGDFNLINKVGNQIVNNEIDSTWTYGIYIYGQDSLLIEGNDVNALTRGNLFGDGIYIIYAANTAIKGNLVLAEDWSFYWTNTAASVVAQVDGFNEMSNNMIVSNTDYAVYLVGVDSINIWYNSFQSFGTFPTLFMNTFTTFPVTEVDMRNNILAADAGVALDMGGMTDTVYSKCDNNDYYTATGTTLIDINGITYPDLASWQTAVPLLNISSLEGSPQFLSRTDLHVIGSFVNDSGDASVPINIDIDGEVRPSVNGTNVDIGADEFDPPTCPPVTFINTFNPTLDSITITWGGAALVDYQYSIVPVGSPIGAGVLTTLDSLRVGGLTPSTTYDLYVRIICGRGDTSLWLGPSTFSTAIGIPYFEDFETFPAGIIGNPYPKGWTSTGVVANPRWESEDANNGLNENSFGTGPVWDHTFFGGPTNGIYMFMETSGGIVGDTADFVSPPVFVDSSQNVFELSYWYFFHGANISGMDVLVRAGGVETLLSTITGQQQLNQATDPWIKDSVLVSGYAGQSIQIIFRGTNVACCSGDIAIDDVSLDIVAPLDAAPIVLTEPIDDSLQCYTAAENVTVRVFNGGTQAIDFTTDPMDVDVDVSGSITQTLSVTINTNALNGGLPLASGNSLDVTLGTIPMTATGNYSFVISIDLTGDGNSTNDTLIRNITVLPVSGGTITSSDTICPGDTATLTTTGFYGSIQWQEFDGTNWVDITGATGTSVQVSPANSTDYRVQACGTQNSAAYTLTILNIPAPTIVYNSNNIVVCDSVGTDTLIAGSTIPGVTFNWYASATGDSLIQQGDTLLFTDTARAGIGNAPTDTFYVSASTGAGVDSVDAHPFVGGNGCGAGNMFNVQSNINLGINAFGINSNDPASTAMTVEVWTKAGTYDGFQTNQAAWTLVATVNTVSAGPGNVTLVPLPSPFRLNANALTGMYLNFNAAYSNVATGTPYSNADLTITIGDGLCTPFAGVNTGRAWNGRIYYGGGCEGPRTMVVGEINCNVVGVDELTSLEAFSVYPNPSNGLFTITMNTNTDEDYNLNIRDIQGKQVYSEVISVNGEYRRELDLSTLAKGVYYLQIQDGENSKVEKLIIQ
jgi:hypothetical protein